MGPAFDELDHLDLLEESSLVESTTFQYAPPSIKLQNNIMKPSYRPGASTGLNFGEGSAKVNRKPHDSRENSTF